MASIPVPTEERVGGRTPGQKLRLPPLTAARAWRAGTCASTGTPSQVRRLSVEDTEGYMARAARPYYALSGDRGIRFESLEVRGVAGWAGAPVPAPRPCASGSKRRLAHRGLLCSLLVEVRDRCGHVLVGGEEGAGPFRFAGVSRRRTHRSGYSPASASRGTTNAMRCSRAA